MCQTLSYGSTTISSSYILFYPSQATTINPDLPNQLKTSLSETLTHFYPYAGRIVDNSSIECTDEGVLYAEADVKCCLSEVISKDHHHRGITLKHLLPKLVNWNELTKTPLIIQSNFFICGGFSLGVIGSHEVMDGLGLSTFIRSWALINADQNNVDDHDVDFTVPSSLYPPSHLLTTMTQTLPRNIILGTDTCVTKSFVFEGTSIAALKQKLGTTPQPTRVEAVSALIWKCAMKASRSRSNKFSSSMWQFAVNTRKRWQVPLPDNTPGNHSCSIFVKKVYGDGDKSTKIDDREIMCDLVYCFKDGLKDFCDNYMKKLQDSLTTRSLALLEYAEETKERLKEDDIDLYVVTSWCGFKLYDADFGWGTPDWMGIGYLMTKNFIILMDTKEGDGIEAWIYLEEQHMAAFEQDEDLLMFANQPTLFN